MISGQKPEHFDKLTRDAEAGLINTFLATLNLDIFNLHIDLLPLPLRPEKSPIPKGSFGASCLIELLKYKSATQGVTNG
jgi:hypothetical protein